MLKRSTMGATASSTRTPAKRKAVEIAEVVGPTKIVIALDIESGGEDMIRNPLLAVGWYICELGHPEAPLAKGYVSLRPLQYIEQSSITAINALSPGAAINDVLPMVQTQQFDQKCLEEFWHNAERCPMGRQMLERFEREAVDHRVGMTQLRELIDSFDDGVDFKAVIISDNAPFDFGWIDYHFSQHGLRRLHLRSDGRYRRIFDVVDYRRGLFAMDHGERQFGEKEIIERLKLDINPDMHDHMPDNDARYICLFYHKMMEEAARRVVTSDE